MEVKPPAVRGSNHETQINKIWALVQTPGFSMRFFSNKQWDGNWSSGSSKRCYGLLVWQLTRFWVLVKSKMLSKSDFKQAILVGNLLWYRWPYLKLLVSFCMKFGKWTICKQCDPALLEALALSILSAYGRLKPSSHFTHLFWLNLSVVMMKEDSNFCLYLGQDLFLPINEDKRQKSPSSFLLQLCVDSLFRIAS